MKKIKQISIAIFMMTMLVNYSNQKNEKPVVYMTIDISQEGDDANALIERINSRHGVHIIEHAAAIGLGSREYELKRIDRCQC